MPARPSTRDRRDRRPGRRVRGGSRGGAGACPRGRLRRGRARRAARRGARHRGGRARPVAPHGGARPLARRGRARRRRRGAAVRRWQFDMRWRRGCCTTYRTSTCARRAGARGLQGGRLVAVTNRENHLEEMFRLVGVERWELPFGAENGGEILLLASGTWSSGTHRDGEFADAEPIRAYFGSSERLAGYAALVPELEEPLIVHRRWSCSWRTTVVTPAAELIQRKRDGAELSPGTCLTRRLHARRDPRLPDGGVPAWRSTSAALPAPRPSPSRTR